MAFRENICRMNEDIQDVQEKRKVLCNNELFVLDNSLRESTVGQLRGHTIDNKWKIYNEVKKIGFQHIIVASFSHMTRLGDTFIKQLAEKKEDFSKLYAFSELIESIDKNRIPDTETIPVGLMKCKELGLYGVIMEFDLVFQGIDYTKFKVRQICQLLSDRMKWCRENLAPNARIFFNFRDLPDAMKKKPKRVFKTVNYLSSLCPEERPFGLIYEESGKYLPEELGAWTAAIRKEMDACGFQDGHLLVHVHERWGLAVDTQLECIARGANGVWASLCEEGAAMGHCSTTMTVMNLIRMGNKRVLKQYNCTGLRQAAINVQTITTGFPPHIKQPIYGERALDLVFGMPTFATDEFDIAGFFGEKPLIRMTTLASKTMIATRLKNVFGEDPQFTEAIGHRMREVMLEDLHKNRKEEYMSPVGLAILFDRSGGKLTAKMSEVIANDKPKQVHARRLIADVRAMWDEWDIRDGEIDDELEFDAFYNGFLAPYFGCYRCDETKMALKAIDMDEDGKVDWNEFAVYLQWAVREYPQLKDAEELLSTAFRKGLIPAMQDEVVQGQK